jgi:3-dehydrotetronate 4-kinase
LLEVMGAPIAIACPAFPAAGRSIYQGHLFVGQLLLSDSSMKDHPLTPMHDANLVRVLQRQSKGKVGLIPLPVVTQGSAAVREALAAAQKAGYRLMIADAVRDEDLCVLGEALADARLITGGSGIGMGLPDNFRRRGRIGNTPLPSRMTAPRGKPVILAGSCSAATRGQVQTAIDAGFPALRIVPLDIASGAQTAERVADWIMRNTTDRPTLVYSSEAPEEVKRIQEQLGRERAGNLVEHLLADVSVILRDSGYSRFIVAGGETSGAVVEALGARALRIGPEIAPGVPWTRSIGAPDLALALKSGNFGGPDFFATALDLLDD